MSIEEQDVVRGRLGRERDELKTQAALLEAEVRSLGRSFLALGQDLMRKPPTINVDRSSVDTALSGWWDTLTKYQESARNLAEKESELGELKK